MILIPPRRPQDNHKQKHRSEYERRHILGYGYIKWPDILPILTDLHDDVDFTTETGLIENGILNSLDIVSIITEVSDRFDVTIPAEEIMPENFDSAEALWALICRLDED